LHLVAADKHGAWALPCFSIILAWLCFAKQLRVVQHFGSYTAYKYWVELPAAHKRFSTKMITNLGTRRLFLTGVFAIGCVDDV
jgi:hypothetical protein